MNTTEVTFTKLVSPIYPNKIKAWMLENKNNLSAISENGKVNIEHPSIVEATASLSSDDKDYLLKQINSPVLIQENHLKHSESNTAYLIGKIVVIFGVIVGLLTASILWKMDINFFALILISTISTLHIAFFGYLLQKIASILRYNETRG